MPTRKGNLDQDLLKGNLSTEQADKVPLSLYKDLFLSSIWVIAALLVGCVAIAFLVTKLTRPAYRVTTDIMVGKADVLSQTSNYDAIWTGEHLASTYAQMLTSLSVLNQVRPMVNSSISVGDLKDAITVSPIANSQLIEIDVEYYKPEVAVEIANNLVQVFSSQIENNQVDSATNQDDTSSAQLKATENEIARLQVKLQAESLQLYNQRVDTINNSIGDLRNQIVQINQELVPLQAATDLSAADQLKLANDVSRNADLDALLKTYQDQLAALIVKGPSLDSLDFASSQDAILLDQNQRVYFSLLQDYQTLKMTKMQNLATVTQVDQPILPGKPVRPNLAINLVLGFAAGLLLSMVYLFVVFDGGIMKNTKLNSLIKLAVGK
jgi:capsular polysaccharide biosynthesis protein